jgi:hypothetical protein
MPQEYTPPELAPQEHPPQKKTYTLHMTNMLLRSPDGEEYTAWGVMLILDDSEIVFNLRDVSLDRDRLACCLCRIERGDVPYYQVRDVLEDLVATEAD